MLFNIMKNYLKSFAIIGAVVLLSYSIVYAAILQPFQGGTGFGSATTTDVGKVLTVSSSSPFLTYSLSSTLSNITFAGLVDSIFNLVGGTGISISTSTSPSTITITNTGVQSISAGSGISVSSATGTPSISNTGVLSFNGSNGAVTGVGSISSVNNLLSFNNSTGAVTATVTTTPTFSNITDTGIATSSFVATDSNGKFIATTTSGGTPSSGGVVNIPSLFSSSSASATTGSYTIPAGVTSIIIGLNGAQGSNYGSAIGGLGGSIQGTLSVSPGTVYYYGIDIGGAGGGAYNGAAGGGSTWFSATSTPSTSTILMVAGGGGGGGGQAGASSNGTNGGMGGGTSGTGGVGSMAGGGGTQSSGGGGGSGTYNSGSSGMALAGGGGGNGSTNAGGGGGGGGGFYGGGGGGAANFIGGGGGGGGSSYVSSTLSSTSTNSGINSGNASIYIYQAGAVMTGQAHIETLQFGPANVFPFSVGFTTPFTTIPSCTATPNTNTNVWISSISTSTIVFNVGTFTANMQIDYQCF